MVRRLSLCSQPEGIDVDKFITMKALLMTAAYGPDEDGPYDWDDVINAKVEYVFHAEPPKGWGSIIPGEYKVEVVRTEVTPDGEEEPVLTIHLQLLEQ